MRWERARYAIELTDEPAYSFASADNSRKYIREYLLAPGCRPFSKHSVSCSQDGEARGSAILGASGGPTGIHDRSCVLLDSCCFVAVGDRVACLALPDLGLLWQAEADTATCFGLYATADEKHLVIHGELEISKVTLAGHKEWAFSGRDIFTGTCTVAQGSVLVTDFNGERYSIDLERGHVER